MGEKKRGREGEKRREGRGFVEDEMSGWMYGWM